MPVALVVEMVYLLADLFAGLACEKLVAFDHARIVRNEPRRLSGGAERVKHPVAPRHVLRIEISHAARRFKTYFVHFCCSKIGMNYTTPALCIANRTDLKPHWGFGPKTGKTRPETPPYMLRITLDRVSEMLVMRFVAVE